VSHRLRYRSALKARASSTRYEGYLPSQGQLKGSDDGHRIAATRSRHPCDGLSQGPTRALDPLTRVTTFPEKGVKMTRPSRTEQLEAAHERLEEAVRLLESADEPLLADEADTLADAVDLRIALPRP
jgi:hypothetical protein